MQNVYEKLNRLNRSCDFCFGWGFRCLGRQVIILCVVLGVVAWPLAGLALSFEGSVVQNVKNKYEHIQVYMHECVQSISLYIAHCVSLMWRASVFFTIPHLLAC